MDRTEINAPPRIIKAALVSTIFDYILNSKAIIHLNDSLTGFDHTTPGASLAYTCDRPEEGKDDDFSQATVKFGYNPVLVDVELFGSYIHWLDAATYQGEGDAEQYWNANYQNPGRWLEAGLRFNF